LLAIFRVSQHLSPLVFLNLSYSVLLFLCYFYVSGCAACVCPLSAVVVYLDVLRDWRRRFSDIELDLKEYTSVDRMLSVLDVGPDAPAQ
jgi:hypothetical protein